MTDHGIVGVDVALRRQVDALTLRFPDVDRGELEQLVRDTYDRLKDEAAVESHLVSMTEGQVTDELRLRGETVHVRSEDAAE
ncbi:hypothetical protein OWR29_23365 [Actinoplanes sp. Pm04-4]|uniref:Uncharacterized protein n=1 Tax=Paractinoplanes pyxinae TaxID=2997416 RepID=A0ABT4B373_9ACTN|nr:hypothetical protein [Actinoplanes pyxinae]MCY1140948.1 hypothetical protein [Actinoplanes pyxinae]